MNYCRGGARGRIQPCVPVKHNTRNYRMSLLTSILATVKKSKCGMFHFPRHLKKTVQRVSIDFLGCAHGDGEGSPNIITTDNMQLVNRLIPKKLKYHSEGDFVKEPHCCCGAVVPNIKACYNSECAGEIAKPLHLVKRSRI